MLTKLMIIMKKRFVKFISVIAAVIAALSLFACKAETSGTSSDNNTLTQYTVEDAYFSKATFSKSRLANVDVKSGETTYRYSITIKSSCCVPIYEYKADVKLLSASGETLGVKTVDKLQELETNEEFEFYFHVSNNVYDDIYAVTVIFSGKSHQNPEKINVSRKYTVTFVYNNGLPDTTRVVVGGKTVATPIDPVKENYVFDGWYEHPSGGVKFDFSNPITKNISLYARYKVDAVTITNKISTDLIKGVVKIYNKCYNSFLGIETSSATMQGSGFCFHVSDEYFYVLTNCHVAYKLSSYENQKFTIQDYQGKTYEGYLYKNPNKNVKAIAASYDLACLYFKTSSTNVKALPFERTNSKVGTDVISLGAPNSQSNTITYGYINGYKKITLKDTTAAQSNVQFDIISHNAFIDHGSSGGPLLNANLQVIGVNYAGNDDSKAGFAIPAEKMYEFLQQYVYN